MTDEEVAQAFFSREALQARLRLRIETEMAMLILYPLLEEIEEDEQ